MDYELSRDKEQLLYEWCQNSDEVVVYQVILWDDRQGYRITTV